MIHRFYYDPCNLGRRIVISPKCSDVIMLLLRMYSSVFFVVPVYEGSMSFWNVLFFFCTVTLLVRLPGRKLGPCGDIPHHFAHLWPRWCLVTYVVPRHGQGYR